MLFFKFLHIIFFVSWMSGLLYLPRLFVYHSISFDEISYNRFLLMEKKLIIYIIIPSFFLTIFSGFSLLYYFWFLYKNFFWIYIKIFFVFLLFLFNIFCFFLFFKFKNKINFYKNKFYRIFNEFPFILFIIIVFLVIFKPF